MRGSTVLSVCCANNYRQKNSNFKKACLDSVFPGDMVTSAKKKMTISDAPVAWELRLRDVYSRSTSTRVQDVY